jgi:hypothetical protein
MMIAIAKKPRQDTKKQAHDRFLEMLPGIQRRVAFAFRGVPSEPRLEWIQEAVANAYVAFVELVDRGKASLAFATPLANYAIRRVLAARHVGSGLGSGDVLSPYARSNYGIIVESLDTFDEAQGEWRATLVEDRRAGPAEIAAARIDIAAWLRSLPRRNRRIAKILASGESTSAVASQFHLSCARVSQLRGELEASWQEFQGREP